MEENGTLSNSRIDNSAENKIRFMLPVAQVSRFLSGFENKLKCVEFHQPFINNFRDSQLNFGFIFIFLGESPVPF